MEPCPRCGEVHATWTEIIAEHVNQQVIVLREAIDNEVMQSVYGDK